LNQLDSTKTMSTKPDEFILYWTFQNGAEITKYHMSINHLITHRNLEIYYIMDENGEVDLDNLVDYFVTSRTYTKNLTTDFLMCKDKILGIIISASIVAKRSNLRNYITESFEQYKLILEQKEQEERSKMKLEQQKMFLLKKESEEHKKTTNVSRTKKYILKFFEDYKKEKQSVISYQNLAINGVIVSSIINTRKNQIKIPCSYHCYHKFLNRRNPCSYGDRCIYINPNQIV
jgi:hypothetical protein